MTPATTAGAYDVLAPAYDLLTEGYAYGPWLEVIERLARAHGLRGRRALDVASGTGKSLEALLGLGYEAVGCDGSPGMVAVARAKLAGRAEIHVADMRELPVYGGFSRRRDGLWRRFLVRRARRERRTHALAAVDR